MYYSLFLFLSAGGAAGVLAGLFGIGGGRVMVPVLIVVLATRFVAGVQHEPLSLQGLLDDQSIA